MLATTSDLLFLLGRLLFGGIIAVMGLNHFTGVDEMAQYAESKGVPYARIGVIASGAMLVLGGLAITIGLYPMIGAGMVLAFFLIVTPVMHDFWTIDDPEQRQQQMNDFLKNAALTGTTLLLVAIGGATWPYALSL